MRQKTYLNVILTVNAVLLSAMLWVQLTGSSVEPVAAAQTSTMQDGGFGSGIPNAGAQRQKMIESLRNIDSSLQAIRKTMDAKVKVEIANVDELRSDEK